MIKDVSAGEGELKSAGDVCIVGAGIAGLMLAEKLRGHGRRVVVLESGGREHDETIHGLNAVVSRDRVHLGANDGRFRGLGGTSTRWGGQLLPLLAQDLAARPQIEAPAWPIAKAALDSYLGEVERLFGVDDGPYDGRFAERCRGAGMIPLADPVLRPRFSKWPTFKNRNVAALFREMIEGDPDLEVWLNATVTGFGIDREAGRTTRVIARDMRGRGLEVSAKAFVLAAGAIESTRLLLALDRAHDDRVFADCDALGRYFQDHLSAPLARLVPLDRRRLNRVFGQRFAGTTMRSLRFELDPARQAEDGVASCFGHLVFEADEASGFALLRDLLRGRQEAGGGLDLGLAAKLLGQLPYFVSLTLWRYGLRQLRWPDAAAFNLVVDVEQRPDRDNRVLLDDERDPMGMPRAAIDWRGRAPELATFAAYTRRFAEFWRRHGLDRLAALDWSIDPQRPDERVFDLARDIYHPTGSTRMSLDRRGGVVDSDLRTHALANLWVASTSVFPSSGSANPTLTLMQLARRLGDHLGKMRL